VPGGAVVEDAAEGVNIFLRKMLQVFDGEQVAEEHLGEVVRAGVFFGSAAGEFAGGDAAGGSPGVRFNDAVYQRDHEGRLPGAGRAVEEQGAGD
jgi:hypothetical protein